MRKGSAGLVILACFLAACSTERVRKVRIEIPDYLPFRLDDYRTVSVTNFRVVKDIPDFDLGREFTDYLESELRFRLKNGITHQTIAWDREDLEKDPAFWKSIKTGALPALFLTGTVRYNQEIRKALIDVEKKEVDGPFRMEKKGLTERRIYTLEVDFFLIEAETGAVVLKKNYKETRFYPNVNQPFSYAFYELVGRVKQKFFHAVLGEENDQERYLIMK